MQHTSSGHTTHRALAALLGGGFLLGWALVMHLIDAADHPGAEEIAYLAQFAVTGLGLGGAWLVYRWIRHLDPEDDLHHPGWPDLAALWLLERYERTFPKGPVYPDRPRTRQYIHAANRGFHSFLTDSIVELERQPPPANNDANPSHDATPLNIPGSATPDPGARPLPHSATTTPPDQQDPRPARATENLNAMRLRRRQAISPVQPDAPAISPARAETQASSPTNRTS
ncbi:MAG: hypothetical protein HQL63_03380 [Magnetococcales bacterium]|nr:hypothetical protein [Magnetococcales bacterium]MBF0322205.1 hypothetical protein [Magnetococcales bacterium]